jgi:hypothetical protein
MKQFFAAAISLLSSVALSCAADDSVAYLAESRLMKASCFDKSFEVGFAAEPSRNTIALIVLLGEVGAVDRFRKMTEVPGVPSLYGVIGLRLSDRGGEIYKRKFAEVLVRDGELEVQTHFHDDTGTDRVKDLMVIPEARKDSKIISFGQYAAVVFRGQKLENEDYVIQNGLLAERLVNPYLRISMAEKELLNGDSVLMKQFDEGEQIIKNNLIYKNPLEILKMVGFSDEKTIREWLAKP